MTLLTRRQLILAKEESVYGTDPTPAYGPLLKACGLSETVVSATSVTYEPVSTSFDSVTIYFNNSGVLHKATGCRGSFTLNAEVGAIPTIAFTFTGIYAAPTDVSISAPTYANQADPLIFKCLQSLSFDMANETVYRELVGCDKEVLIVNRAPAGEAVIEAVPVGTHNFFNDATGSSTGNLTFEHGTTAGNIVTFTAGQIDLSNPSYSDQDGVQMLTLPYIATPTNSGNDEISLVFT